MKTKLNWKKKWLDDKSGYWYSAKVSILNWEYIVEDIKAWENESKFVAGVYFSKFDDDVVRLSKTIFKTEQQAKNACEKHLKDTAEKFNRWFKTK
jgi:hypothetical protein